MAEEIRFAPKDAKIIKDNPGKSPYELKDLGLSQAAFDKLMSGDTTAGKIISDENLDKDNNPPADQPENDKDPKSAPTEQDAPSASTNVGQDPKPTPLIPKLQSPIEGQKPVKLQKLSEQVMVLTPSGVRNSMGRTFATKLVKQDPRYKIVG